MFHPSRSRLGLTLCLLFFLAVPCAQAAEPTGAPSLANLVDQAWITFLSWLDNGCILDPHGGCRDAQTVDNGCVADPHGGCRAAQVLDNGCIADPSGGCRDAQSVDNGCIADPDGRCRAGS